MTTVPILRSSAMEAASKRTDFIQRVFELMEADFWLRVSLGKFSTPDVCWEWTGQRMQRRAGGFRYGIFSPYTGLRVLAHRFSFELAYGSFDNDLHVLHKCDNPSCVRPDHLFLGTPHDNLLDAYKKGRRKSMRGHRSPMFCKKGHTMTGDNVRLEGTGYRRCVICDKANQKRRYDLRVGKAGA